MLELLFIYMLEFGTHNQGILVPEINPYVSAEAGLQIEDLYLIANFQADIDFTEKSYSNEKLQIRFFVDNSGINFGAAINYSFADRSSGLDLFIKIKNY